jgi:hypothetical protein
MALPEATGSAPAAHERPEPIPFPDTYEDLQHVLTILGNGGYGRKRIDLMGQPDDTFERVKGLEGRLLRALAEHTPAENLTDEDRQSVRFLFLLMGVPGAQDGSITRNLQGVGAEVHVGLKGIGV